MASHSKVRQESIIELILSLHEGEDCIEVRAEADPFGEVRHSLPAREIAAIEQIQTNTGVLFESFGSQDRLEEFGRSLFSTVFQGKLRGLFESVQTAARNRRARLLILIKLDPASRLYLIPWELLHDGYCFLAKDTRSAVVRYFDQPLPISKIAVTPPLRVLLTSANPRDLDSIAVAEEEFAVRHAYEQAGQKVQVVIERHVSIEKLEQIWRQATAPGEQFHVWHHCGHGGERNSGYRNEFILCLESDGLTQPIEVERLQEAVSFCPDLRVAIINVCRGSSRIGLAPALARINVPVVIGFQHSVHDTAALQFAKALHESMLQLPVEFATSIARKSLRINDPGIPDWAQALVLSRRRDRGLLIREAGQGKVKKNNKSESGVSIGVIEGNHVTVTTTKVPVGVETIPNFLGQNRTTAIDAIKSAGGVELTDLEITDKSED